MLHSSCRQHTPHAMTPRSHSPYPPPKKNKKKKFGERQRPHMDAPTGGVPPSQHDAPRFTHNQGPHARHTATIRTAWSDALSIRSTPPNAARLCAKRPSARKQRTTHQHTRQPDARKALTWHPQGKSNPPAGQNSPPEAAQGKPCIFFRFAYVYKYYLYNTRNKENKIFPRATFTGLSVFLPRGKTGRFRGFVWEAVG